MLRACALLLALALMSFCGASVPRVLLRGGRTMPSIALGTFVGLAQNGSSNLSVRLSDVVESAIDCGYRSFDGAAVYGNERDLGEGIRRKIDQGIVTRQDIFVTTKLWNTHHAAEEVEPALRGSLVQLGLDYVDMFLMHWPMAFYEDYSLSDVDYMETWRAMEIVLKTGLTRAIGLSNFNEQQLKRVLQEGSTKPAVLQIEIHPVSAQFDLVNFAQSQSIVVMGYSPLGSLVRRYGQDLPGPKIDDPTLVSIANKYGKTTPQIVLRWLVDRNIVPVTKTMSASRLRENIDIFDFRLEEEEIRKINSFDSGTRFNLPSFWQTHPHYPFEKTEHPLADPFSKPT